LGADAVADREQEQEEERRLERTRHLDAELADRECGEQRARDVAKRESRYLARPDREADRQRQEQRELGIAPQRRDGPVPDRHALEGFPCVRSGWARRCGGGSVWHDAAHEG
jgi:hypothetical protein